MSGKGAMLPRASSFQASVRLALVAALSTGAGAAAAQDSLGRLFFTPAQRVQLDESRRRPPAPEPVWDVPNVPQPVQSLSVDGIVRRSDGQATVWVNRQPTAAPQAVGPVRIGPVRDAAEGADLRLPDNGRQVRVKVGQEVDVQSGRIQERYRQRPAPPTPSASGSASGPSPESSPSSAPPSSAPGQAIPAELANAPRAGAASSAEGSAPGPAARPDVTREPARDAAVERLLRELGRRLDEPQRDPARSADPTR